MKGFHAEVVAAATVRVTGYPGDLEKAGQGVLAGNGYLLTAAHCLEHDNDTGSRVVLGERVVYGIETARGEKLTAAPVFIESVSDIAVLGPPDPNVYPGEWAAAYESFRAETSPVAVWRGRGGGLPPAVAGEEFGVHVRTHFGGWIAGRATFHRAGPPYMWVRTGERLDGRTSGGPIVNDSGELLGVVTAGGGYLGVTNEGHVPVLRHALPAWLFRAICG